jgi:ParB family chromosome partitioning protein
VIAQLSFAPAEFDLALVRLARGPGDEAVEALHVSARGMDYVFPPLPALGGSAGAVQFLIPASILAGRFAVESGDDVIDLPAPEPVAERAAPERLETAYTLHQATIAAQAAQIQDLRRRLRAATERAVGALADLDDAKDAFDLTYRRQHDQIGTLQDALTQARDELGAERALRAEAEAGRERDAVAAAEARAKQGAALESTQAELGALREQHSELSAAHEAALADARALTDERDSLRASLEELGAARDRDGELAARTERELRDALAEREAAAAEAAAAAQAQEEELTRLRAGVEELSGTREHDAEAAERTERELRETLAEREAAAAEALAGARSREEELVALRDELEAAAERERQRVAELSEAQERELERLRGEEAARVAELEAALEAAREEVERTSATGAAAGEAATREAEAVRSQLAETEAALAEAQEQADALRREADDLRAEIAQLAEEREADAREIEALNARLVEHERRVENEFSDLRIALELERAAHADTSARFAVAEAALTDAPAADRDDGTG